MSSSGGGSGSDMLFFFFILLIIFAVWVGSGGPDRPISFSGPYLNAITGPGQSAEPYDTLFQGASASPHRSAITISKSTSGPAQDDPPQEYVSIRMSPLATESISLAGWSVVSKETGKGIRIPEGTALPKAGRVNVSSSVTLSSGEEIILATGSSPIGISFRENMCTGYFEQHQDFSPSLSLSCPSAYSEYTRTDIDESECEYFSRTVSQCSAVRRAPNDVSSSCEAFVEEVLTYDGCVERHQNDAGFYSSTWRLFAGERKELWRDTRETLLLLDNEGRVVDAFSY